MIFKSEKELKRCLVAKMLLVDALVNSEEEKKKIYFRDAEKVKSL